MIIAVLIKAVPDTAAPLAISTDGKTVVMEDVKFVSNPYDEHAIEEAVVLKESSDIEVLAVSFGGDRARQALRSALAVGADRAILIKEPDELSCSPSPAIVAGVLAALMKNISPDLIIGGRQAVDTDDAQVGERVAEKLGYPHASNIIQIDLDNGKITVCQETQEGHRGLELSLPALVTVQKGINTPRYPTVPEVMKARRKPLEEVNLEELDLSEDLFTGNIKISELKVFTPSRTKKILPDDIGAQAEKILEILRSNNLLV